MNRLGQRNEAMFLAYFCFHIDERAVSKFVGEAVEISRLISSMALTLTRLIFLLSKCNKISYDENKRNVVKE